jgi:hypothetical protein
MLSRLLDTEEQNIGLFVNYGLFFQKKIKRYTNRAGFPILSSSDRCGLCKKQFLAMTSNNTKREGSCRAPNAGSTDSKQETARRAKLAFDWYHHVVVMLVDNAQAITAHSASRAKSI